MTYLVDSNVLSELTRPAPDPQAVGWLTAHEEDLVVDSIVLGELKLGILSLNRGRRRALLERWFKAVVQTIECLPGDSAVGLRWAGLVAELRRKGRPLPAMDSMIAATALTHGLVLATRNVRDFEGTGVKLVDPFEKR